MSSVNNQSGTRNSSYTTNGTISDINGTICNSSSNSSSIANCTFPLNVTSPATSSRSESTSFLASLIPNNRFGIMILGFASAAVAFCILLLFLAGLIQVKWRASKRKRKKAEGFDRPAPQKKGSVSTENASTNISIVPSHKLSAKSDVCIIPSHEVFDEPDTRIIPSQNVSGETDANVVPIMPSNEVSNKTNTKPSRTFDYYLSYKAKHSTLQLQPLYVAMSIHDILASSGYVGLFPDILDVDEDDAAIAGKVRQCKVLLTYIHDETCLDSRCQVEWQTAISLKMSILCIGDATNCKVSDLRRQIFLTHPHLDSCTWMSYHDVDRHMLYKDVCKWFNAESIGSAIATKMPEELPSEKSYHYFVSQKKKHSRLGFQPEVIARAFHDVLQYRGFKGSFDVDDPDDLKIAVKKSCAAIIFLHDETCQSEWCRLEWQLIFERRLPLLCIVDTSSIKKQDMLAQIRTVSPELQDYEWLELSDETRQAIQTRTLTWLDQQLQEGHRYSSQSSLPGQM